MQHRRTKSLHDDDNGAGKERLVFLFLVFGDRKESRVVQVRLEEPDGERERKRKSERIEKERKSKGESERESERSTSKQFN